MKKGCLFVIFVWLIYYMVSKGMLQRLSMMEEDFEEEQRSFMKGKARGYDRDFDEDSWYGGWGQGSDDDVEDASGMWD